MKHWERFKSAVSKVDSAGLSTLREAATRDSVRDLQQKIGVNLGDELVELLLIHNGQEQWSDGELTQGLFSGYHFNGVDEIAEHHRSLSKQLAEGFLTYESEVEEPALRQGGQNWRPEWIPFGQLTFETALITDLAPGPDGTVGQVFLRSNEHTLSKVLSPNLGSFLLRYAELLTTKGTHPSLWTSFAA